MFPHHSLDLAVVGSGSIPLLTPCYNIQTYSSDWTVRSNDYSEDRMHSTSTSFLMAQRWPCSALSVTIALRTWSAYICTWLDTTLFTRNNAGAVCKHEGRSRQRWMGLVHITSWYPIFNGSHFGLPPSEIHRIPDLPPKIVWTMTYSHRPHPKNGIKRRCSL